MLITVWILPLCVWREKKKPQTNGRGQATRRALTRRLLWEIAIHIVLYNDDTDTRRCLFSKFVFFFFFFLLSSRQVDNTKCFFFNSFELSGWMIHSLHVTAIYIRL